MVIGRTPHSGYRPAAGIYPLLPPVLRPTPDTNPTSIRQGIRSHSTLFFLSMFMRPHTLCSRSLVCFASLLSMLPLLPCNMRRQGEQCPESDV